ncbi:MAG TPA: haloacid dehalogenase type II [Geminicoccaceae bacterium]|nr:haloacid dehalogenase type II [Geminicoccaceae bacterium]
MRLADPEAVRACVFDAYGTLLDLASALAAEQEGLGAKAPQLAELWRRKQLEYTWLRSLMRRHLDFWQVTSDALAYSLDALAIEERGLAERLLAAYRKLRPYPEVVGMLERLRATGRRCLILSNGEPGMLQDAVGHAGLGGLLDEVLSVEAVGVYKPAPEVYLLATQRLGLAAREILFVSSNGWDAHGAASFGLRVAWVNRARAPRERLPGAPEVELSDLTGLPDLLAA